MRCRSCGQSLPRGSRICPECGASCVSRGIRHVRCRRCGGWSPAGLRICPACGEAPEMWRNWKLAAVLLILAGALGYAVTLAVPLSGIGGVIPSTGAPETGAGPTSLPGIESRGGREAESTVSPVVEQAVTSRATASPARTFVASPTASSSPVPTNTATPVATNTATRTPTNTATRTPTNTPTRTPTNTATQVPTSTATPVRQRGV